MKKPAAHSSQTPSPVANPCGTFKIELLHTPAKRTLVMPADLTLVEFNEIIQQLFAWRECHLWNFRDAKGDEYGVNEDPLGFALPDPICNRDARKTLVRDILPATGAKATYTYDFGDGWEHRITRMADPKEPDFDCRRTAGPDGIEDIGGPWGLMENLADAEVPDLDELNNRLSVWVFLRHERQKADKRRAATKKRAKRSP